MSEEEGSTSLTTSEDKNKNEVNWGPALLIYSVVFADAVAMSLPTPFLPRMIQEKFKVPVGLYFGMIISAMHLARFVSVSTIGSLSDKYGRRKLILVGIIASVIVTFAFPLIESVYLAIGLRFALGLFNGNFSLSKAFIADITAVGGRSQVFAFWGAVFAASRAFSGAIGGITTGVRVPIPFVSQNDFFLPCLIGACLLLAVFILALFRLPSTPQSAMNNGPLPLSLWRCVIVVWSQKPIRKILVIFWIISYNNSALLMAITLVSNSFGFSTAEIGIVFGLYGICGFTFQLVAFRRLKKRLGLRKLLHLATLILAVFCVIFPTIGVVSGDNLVLKWSLVVFSISLFSAAIMNGVPVSNNMMVNMAAKDRQGLVSGTADSLGALMRGLSPLIQGALFSAVPSFYAPFVLFAIFTIMYLTASLLSLWLPEEVEGKKLKEENELISPSRA